MTEDLTLAEFIAKYAEPYDSEADSYDRPPYAEDTKEGKNDPIYNVHPYPTKVPPRAIVPYLLHYTKPDDLILDPFCGSGMTGVAALMCVNPPQNLLEQFPELKYATGPRHAILNDLSTAACHIARNYTHFVDLELFHKEFDRIAADIRGEIASLYMTEHYEPAINSFNPRIPSVAEKLRNGPSAPGKLSYVGDDDASKTWQLVDRSEVERRLGYSVNLLRMSSENENTDLSKVRHWICIPAEIQYTLWSDVYKCHGYAKVKELTGNISKRGENAGRPVFREKRVLRGCGKDILLWEAAVDVETQNVSEDFRCPHCRQEWNKLALSLNRTIPVWVSYTYSVEGKNKRYERPISSIDIQRVTHISSIGAHPGFLDIPIDTGRELMTMGPANRGMTRLSDFYTPRNQQALGLLWERISQASSAVRDTLRFTFTAILDVASRRNRYPQQAVMSSTLYVPSIQVEMNVFSQYARRVKTYVKGVEMFPASGSKSGSQVYVRNGDARELGEIPDDTIDYVFADPPFGGNIYYADASILVDSWLEKTTDETKEIVFNRQRRKDADFRLLRDYTDAMAVVFHELFRVLKPGRWCTVEFNNSDGEVFEGIKLAIRQAGFEIANMLLFDKKQKSFKQVKGLAGEEDVVDKDVLFNLLKPSKITLESGPGNEDLEHQLVEAVREHLRTLPERIRADPHRYSEEHRATATINSMLMNTLIPKGVSVELLNLPFIERVCSRYFRKVGQRWYLRGEAVGNNVGGERLIEEEVAIRDEISAIEWIRQCLKAGPVQLGELKPLWMRATGLLRAEVSQQLDLQELLAENFWKDHDTNKWREPTEEERERMNDDRSLQVLHDAERFITGSLHIATTDEERCGWIDVLFKACKAVEENDLGAMPVLRGFDEQRGYLLISRLFRSILKDNADPELYRRAEKQARVGSQRLNDKLEAKREKVKASQRKERGPTLFEGIED